MTDLSPQAPFIAQGRRTGGAQDLRIISYPDPEKIPQLSSLPPQLLRDMQVVSRVLPFRVSSYVVDHLIDWRAAPDDPIFRLVFPVRGMLEEADFWNIERALNDGEATAAQTVQTIRTKLNPHPGDQLELNRPYFAGIRATGLQHKYRSTVLFFPSDGQTCHSYCTFCFRWAQFAGEPEQRMASSDRELLADYLTAHPEVTDLLITGGDAFMVKARRLRHFLEPLLEQRLAHVTSIRFGTKALTFWPYRFLTDPDADALIDLIRELSDAGKQVAIMIHHNHWRELTPEAEAAASRLRAAGAVLRTQGPLLAGINDEPAVWQRLWRRQVELGMVPYYMFVARDTGPNEWFKVPLARGWEIYAAAARSLSGLARTVRGPSMSASPGKIEIVGVAELANERVFVLRFLQARRPDWCYRPFFARFDPNATWISDLRPAGDQGQFFFEGEDLEGLSEPFARSGSMINAG